MIIGSPLKESSVDENTLGSDPTPEPISKATVRREILRAATWGQLIKALVKILDLIPDNPIWPEAQ